MWLYLLHIFLLSLLFISFYPFEMNVVKRWNSDEDNSAEVWYPLPGCVHNRKIGSGAGCEARRWKFMNNEGGLSLPKVPNLKFPWFGNGEFFFFESLSRNVCSLYVAEEHLIYFDVNKMYKLQREKKWWVYNGANQRPPADHTCQLATCRLGQYLPASYTDGMFLTQNFCKLNSLSIVDHMSPWPIPARR